MLLFGIFVAGLVLGLTIGIWLADRPQQQTEERNLEEVVSASRRVH